MRVLHRGNEREVVDGEIVATLRKYEVVSREHMKTYYGLSPGDKSHAAIAAPIAYDRLVILRGGSTSYVVVPYRHDLYMFL